MPAGQVGFCKIYKAASNVDALIKAKGTEFFKSYAVWENKNPLPTLPEDMFSFFLDWKTSEAALNKGDKSSANPAGEVRDSHCEHFNDFVIWGHAQPAIDLTPYTPAQLASVASLTGRTFPASTPYYQAFQAGLLKLFLGKASTLTPMEKAALNGALLVRVKNDRTSIGFGLADQSLYAIPGSILLNESEQDLTDPFWGLVDTFIDKAFDATGTRLINVYGAVQLRLGSPNGLFEPINVAPGLIIKGGM